MKYKKGTDFEHLLSMEKIPKLHKEGKNHFLMFTKQFNRIVYLSIGALCKEEVVRRSFVSQCWRRVILHSAQMIWPGQECREAAT
jgi:hypothetical protein